MGAVWTVRRNPRLRRSAVLARLGLRTGMRAAAAAPALFTSAGERRQQLRMDLSLRTADDVADTLGSMKGVMMKLGQMVSYIDERVPAQYRRAFSRLQSNAPPMSEEMARRVIFEELGDIPEKVFALFDPIPIAAASIGQVHRAVTHGGHAVAVKVQYPDVAEAMTADLDNVGLLRRVVRMTFPGLDTDELIDELRERIGEELDYVNEAANQKLFADHYRGHPAIHVPDVIPELSTRRVLTTELVVGRTVAQCQAASQAERDRVAEIIYRFVFRSLYSVSAFNGDPHPGNYVVEDDGRVAFLDFGLVKRFSPGELQPLVDGVEALAVAHDEEAFRSAIEEAGFIPRGAPVSTRDVVDHLGIFYEPVMESQEMTLTPEFASRIVGRFFDTSSAIAPFAAVPRSYAVLQRINIGLFAVLGSLHARANWRAIAEEIWPFIEAAPSTPLGEREAAWLATREAQASWGTAPR